MRTAKMFVSAGALAIAAAASASTVNLDTGTADWQVAFAPIPVDYPMSDPIFGASSAAVEIAAGNIPGVWASAPNAEWIGTGTNPNDTPGFYKYTLSVDVMDNTRWCFHGDYTSDNQVIFFSIDDQVLVDFDADLQSNPQQFRNFDQDFWVTGSTIDIEVIVYNERVTNDPNPTGFLLEGDAEMKIIPLPTASALGFAGVGLIGARRRRALKA